MQLYVLAAQCPRDGWRPGVWITAEQRELYRDWPPHTTVGEWKCVNRSCGRRYPLTARAFQEAEEERAKVA